MNSFNPELKLKDTESAIKNKLIDLLTELGRFKFVATIVLEFKKIQKYNKALCSTFYLHSQPQTTINESTINDAFESIYTTITPNIQKSLKKGLVWVI